LKTCWCVEAFFKACPCLALAVGAGAGAGAGTSKAKASALAFALSAAGDAFLCHNDHKNSDISFVLGLAAFLAAQWCYVFCFTRESGGGPSQAQATLCFAYAGSLYAYLYNGLDSALALPVLLYCVSIATTMASSLAAHPGSNASSSLWILGVCGAALFVVSDSCLALTMFVGDHVVPHRRVVIMGTYFAAQLCLSNAFAANE